MEITLRQIYKLKYFWYKLVAGRLIRNLEWRRECYSKLLDAYIKTHARNKDLDAANAFFASRISNLHGVIKQLKNERKTDSLKDTLDTTRAFASRQRIKDLEAENEKLRHGNN